MISDDHKFVLIWNRTSTLTLLFLYELLLESCFSHTKAPPLDNEVPTCLWKMICLKAMENVIMAFIIRLSIAIFIMVIIGKVNGEQPLTVYEAPRGQNVTLPCPIRLTSELLRLYWRKDGNTILTIRHVRGGYDISPATDRYGLTGNNTSLTITDVHRSDAANYTCTVVLGDGGFHDSDAVQLFVTELSVSHCQDTQNSEDEVEECDCHVDGNIVSDLTCTAHGFPYKPAISWKLRDRIRLESSAVNLTMLTNFSSNKTLVCLAEDPVLREHPLNHKHVCVYYQKQDIELSVSHCQDTQNSGGEVDECDCHVDGNKVRSLTCTAHGFPHKTAISWHLSNGFHLDSSVIDITLFSDDVTLVCLAEDPVLRNHPLNRKHVCVYYKKQDIESQPVWKILNVVLCTTFFVTLLIRMGLFFNWLRRTNYNKSNELSWEIFSSAVFRAPLVVLMLVGTVCFGFLLIVSITYFNDFKIVIILFFDVVICFCGSIYYVAIWTHFMRLLPNGPIQIYKTKQSTDELLQLPSSNVREEDVHNTATPQKGHDRLRVGDSRL